VDAARETNLLRV
jgi:Chromo (CHRromatin Organisation MOdifier) domain